MAHDAPVVGVLGKRGFGKTTRLRERIRNELVVVGWDPMVTPNAPRGQLYLPHRFTGADGAAECAELIRDRRRGLLRAAVHSFEPDDFGALVEAVADRGRACVVAIDEASTLCERTVPHPALAWILAYGRHIDVTVIWTARRAAEVARLCTGQAEYLEVFRTTDQADLGALRGAFGAHALSRMPHLEKFEFVSSEE